jgi:hypothetical protein
MLSYLLDIRGPHGMEPYILLNRISTTPCKRAGV